MDVPVPTPTAVQGKFFFISILSRDMLKLWVSEA